MKMGEFKTDPSKGEFDPSDAKKLVGAFEKADELVTETELLPKSEADHTELARRIISEAREGETQPDLASCAAVAKLLIEQQAKTSRNPTETEDASVEVDVHLKKKP
jgi:hypothetical protein